MRRLACAFAAAVMVLVSAGCSDDAEPPAAGAHRKPAPQPNGVAHLTPERAMALARRTMGRLHDAVYKTSVIVGVDGTERRLEIVETLTDDGCAREVRDPGHGRIWVRAMGPYVWLKASDAAGKEMGRTPVQIEILRGRWVRFPAPALLRGCDLRSYVLPPSYVDDLVEAGEVTQVRGRPGRRFTVSGGGVSMDLVVATRGRPVVLRVAVTTPAATLAGPPGLPEGMSYGGVAVLQDVDTGAEVQPPPDRLVIDPAQFQTATA